MKLKYIFFVLLCFSSNSIANASKPKPWTFQFRSNFNHACALDIEDVPFAEALAFCDCMSSMYEERWSEGDFLAFLESDKTSEVDKKFLQGVAKTCSDEEPL